MLRSGTVMLAPLAKLHTKMFMQVRTLHLSRMSMVIHLKMPRLNPTMLEGTIAKWIKAEGEYLEAGDVVCDIQTDVAVVPMEVDEEGVLAKIIRTADSGVIKVGDLIAVVAQDGEDWKEVAANAGYDEVNAATAATKSGPFTPVPKAGGSITPVITTMTEGTITMSYIREGKTISVRDLLSDIQTDKVVFPRESGEDGMVAKITWPEGSSGAQVGTLISLLADGLGLKNAAITISERNDSATSSNQLPGASPKCTNPSLTGPAASLLLSQYNLNPEHVQATGPKGNITKADVLNYIQTNHLSAAASYQVPQSVLQNTCNHTSPTDTELVTIRKMIAKILSDPKQDDPNDGASGVSATGDFSAIYRFKQEYVKSGYKVAINDFMLKAVSLALQFVPEVNSPKEIEEQQLQSNIDISVAVLQKLDQFQGGTLALTSNLGMFGIAEFTAVVHSPQIAIMAVGRTVFDSDTMLPTHRNVMTYPLSFDRRYIDEAQAVYLMKVVQSILERPELLGVGYTSSVRMDRMFASVLGQEYYQQF